MLNLHDQHPRKSRADPLLVLLISLILLNTVVPPPDEIAPIVRLQIRIRRSRPKIIKPRHKMVMKDHQRKPGIRMLVKALRHSTTALKNTGRPQNFVSKSL